MSGKEERKVFYAFLFKFAKKNDGSLKSAGMDVFTKIM
jgi:hypothetical protein